MGSLVVLVDDDLDFLDQTEDFLRSRGFETYACSSSLKAFRQIALRNPAAVLLDLDMPRKSGFDILRCVRSSPITKKLPVLLLTAHPPGEKSAKGFEEGLDDFISKPFRPEELVHRLNVLISRYKDFLSLLGPTGFPAIPSSVLNDFFTRAILLELTDFDALERGELASDSPFYLKALKLFVFRVLSSGGAPYETGPGKILIADPGEIGVDQLKQWKRHFKAVSRLLKTKPAGNYLSPDALGVLRHFARPELRVMIVRSDAGDFRRALAAASLEMEMPGEPFREIFL